MKLLLNSPKNTAVSGSLPYPAEPSPCAVILGSPLSTASLRLQDKSETQWQEAATGPVGGCYLPWDEARAREVHTEPRGVCHSPWPSLAQPLLRAVSPRASETWLYIRFTQGAFQNPCDHRHHQLQWTAKFENHCSNKYILFK